MTTGAHPSPRGPSARAGASEESLWWAAPVATVPVRARIAVSSAGARECEGESEPDRSRGLLIAAAFLAAGAVSTGTVVISDWTQQVDPQGGSVLRELLAAMGGYVVLNREGLTCTTRATAGHLSGVTADLSPVPQLTAVVAALAALADDPSVLEHIPDAETAALISQNLAGLGGRVQHDRDRLAIEPAFLHSGRWCSHGRLDMALGGAVIALVVPGVDVGSAPEIAAISQSWRSAMSAEAHILPGVSGNASPA